MIEVATPLGQSSQIDTTLPSGEALRRLALATAIDTDEGAGRNADCVLT
jgi:hypothetical protein